MRGRFISSLGSIRVFSSKITSTTEALFGIEKLNVPRSDIPAVTHVDYSARIQTVHTDTNERYHALLSAFKEETGCSVLLNTSFNVRGEPIVCTPEDAFHCFMGTGLDILVIGNYFIIKNEKQDSISEDYRNQFALDYCYCRNGPGLDQRHTNFVMCFPNVHREVFEEDNPNNHTKSRLYYMVADHLEFTDDIILNDLEN